MATTLSLQSISTSSTLLLISMFMMVSSRGPVYTPPTVEKLTKLFSRVSVNQGYSVFFGGCNVHITNNGSSADLLHKMVFRENVLRRHCFRKKISFSNSDPLLHLQLSNADLFPNRHDEIDIELLGHEKRRDWVLQTNIYGNGSVGTGREEKFYLWFDPTAEFHEYSVLWNSHHVVFLVDNIPVREVLHNAAISSVYPLRPMSIYATIWDGSKWATHGGKYPVNYKYAPFVVSFKEIKLQGCLQQQNVSALCPKSSLSSMDPVEGEQFAKLSAQQMNGLNWARGKHMFYSYCKDTARYKVKPPECNA